LDQLINQLGFNKPPKIELKQIIAPMPGLVKDILIKEGDAISSGTNLLILEAMKMENILKSHGEGSIKSVEVKIGDKVEKGTILIKL
jgi:biotin carboxyl carrier protein